MAIQILGEERRKAILIAYTANGKSEVLGAAGLRADAAIRVQAQVVAAVGIVDVDSRRPPVADRADDVQLMTAEVPAGVKERGLI